MPFDWGWSDVHSHGYFLDTVDQRLRASQSHTQQGAFGLKQTYTTRQNKLVVSYVARKGKNDHLDLDVHCCFQSNDDYDDLIRSQRKMMATVEFMLVDFKYHHKFYVGAPVTTTFKNRNSTFYVDNFIPMKTVKNKAWFAQELYSDFMIEVRMELKCVTDSSSPLTGQSCDSPIVLTDDFNRILTNQLHCDVVLVVGSEKISANKCILSARCPYFAGLFQSGMIETKNGEVPVKDVDLPVFKELLKYIYTGKVDDKADVDWSELLLAADRYQLDRLKKMCELRVANRLNNDNVVEALNLAMRIDAKILKSAAVGFLNNNCANIS